jgi:hypothetical protein
MVQLNHETQVKDLTIELEGCDAEGLVNIQLAIIELVRNYNWSDFSGDASNTIYPIMNLLEATIPNVEQMQRALAHNDEWIDSMPDDNGIAFPKNMSEEQRQLVKTAFFEIRTGETVQGVNPITQVLRKSDVA